MMKTFKIKSISTPDGMEGNFYKCECEAVLTEEEKDSHECLGPPYLQEEMRMQKEIDDLMDVVGDQTKGFEERLEAYKQSKRIQLLLHEFRIKRIEKALPKEQLKHLILMEVSKRLAAVRLEKKRQYERNDELRAKGVPFVERMKLIKKEKIAWLDKEEERLKNDWDRLEPLPIGEWLTEIDWQFAKERGIVSVIKFNLDRTYAVVRRDYEGEI